MANQQKSSLAAVAPQLPVFKSKELAAENITFDVHAVHETRGGRYGDGWKLSIVRHDTGERGVLLYGDNPVRGDQFRAIAAHIARDGGPVGPCLLDSVDLGAGGNDAWNIVPADHETPRASAATVKGPKA